MFGRGPIFLAAALATAVSVAHADEPSDGAERLFREGNALMDRNSALAAAQRYRMAWQLAPRAKYALNLGVALAETGDFAAATEAFEIYLTDESADPAKRPVVEGRIAEWRSSLGRLELDVTPADAVIAIDGVAPLRGGPHVSVPLAAGPHVVVARRPGFLDGSVTVSAAAASVANARLELQPQPVPVVPADTRWYRPHRTKWVALGLAGVGMIAGTYFGIVATERWASVRDHCPDNICTSRADLALVDPARRAGYAADISFAVAGTALAAGVVLWVLDHRSSHVVVTPQGEGGSIAWRGAF